QPREQRKLNGYPDLEQRIQLEGESELQRERKRITASGVQRQQLLPNVSDSHDEWCELNSHHHHDRGQRRDISPPEVLLCDVAADCGLIADRDGLQLRPLAPEEGVGLSHDWHGNGWVVLDAGLRRW